MDKIKRLSFLLGILLILIIVSFSNLNIIRYKIGEQFSQTIDSSKKVVVITGFVQELSKEFSKFFNPDKYLVITSENELEIKQFVETIKENYGNKSIDIFINSWWSSSNYNLGYKFDVNANNSIKLIEQIIPLIKSGGKIVNISSDINNIEPSDHLLNNYLLVKSSIDKYFKIKSLEHYKDSIAFLTLKIDFAYDTNLTKSILPGINKSTDFIELKPSIEFIIGNNWASLSGREFYSSRINGKKLGYYLELEYPRLDDNSLNKQIITNVFNGENIIEPNIKDKELCVYSNNQNLLSAKLSQIYKIDHSYINFHHGIFTFLEKMISVFVPPKHQIISTLMNYLNTIGRDRTVISINPIIKNKYAVPNYNQILENINSLTRIIYLIAPLNKKDFDEFIKKIPFNIVIIIDFCYDGFVISNNNIKMQDYLTVPNTIITINTFSKFYGLPGIHLSWSIAKKDIGSIITNYFHYPINLYYEKVALQVLNDTQYLDSVKKYYDQERNKLIEILETNKINYWFEFPNTIIIEKTIGIKPGKFDDEYKITKFLAQTGLINYRVYMEGVVIKIRLFISKQEHNDELISKIVQISKFY
jgi:histidinol-phosphate aminotransferase